MDFACFVAPSTRSGGQAKSSYLKFPAEARIIRSRDSGPGGELVIRTGIYAPTHRQTRNRRRIKIPAAYSLIVLISVAFLLVIRFFNEPCMLLLSSFKNAMQKYKIN